jgi:parallel beta-helix repeat protein
MIHKNSYYGFMLVSVSSGNVQGKLTNFSFIGNIVYDSKWNGIRVTGGVTNSTFKNNTFYNCPYHAGFDTYNQSVKNKNLVISGNRIYNCESGMYITGVEDSIVEDNDVFDISEFESKLNPPQTPSPHGSRNTHYCGIVSIRMEDMLSVSSELWNKDMA